MNALILAHQGGWDEMLLVAAPIAAFAFAMRMANRRAKRVADLVRSDRDGVTGSGDPTEPISPSASADPTDPLGPLRPPPSPAGHIDTER